ncbi:hypothetical protein AADG42_18990 [Ammonicoccus fulvus]|uniref:Uncharacterized protein n=1 Tax=Ammonicoccus fulvus TaxID=3138240 RepID=A0ABZ3FTQ2_9ACTN
MASRYLAGPALEAYLQFASTTLSEHCYRFTPTKWRFADLTM